MLCCERAGEGEAAKAPIPFAPHLAEEISHRLGESGLVALARWPGTPRSGLPGKSRERSDE